ncbi:MAG: HD domain-containing protein [Candidatus Acidiferrales bacterium]
MRRARSLGKRFDAALVYAARLHAAQFRKGTARSYIAHLLGVTSTVLTHGGDEYEAIAALLHDAVEDQGGKPQLRKIRRKFGARIARIVDGCTDSHTEPKPPWLGRKIEYLRHLRHADSSTCLVSAADKLYNARETLSDLREEGEKVWNRFRATKEQVLWYYREVEKILRHKCPRALMRDLDVVITDLERQAKIKR